MILSCLILVNCANVPVSDGEYCTVKGKLSYGMKCVRQLSGKKRQMTFDEVLDFLQADEESGKGAAVCQSSKDFAANKSSLEALCKVSNNMCKPEHKKAIKNLDKVTQ